MYYLLTLILAACSIIYELLIAQTTSLLVGNTVVWYCLTIGLYLGCLGVGAACYEVFLKKYDKWKTLCLVEILLSIFGLLIPSILHGGHLAAFYSLRVFPESLAVYSVVPTYIGLTFVIGLLSGIELPLLLSFAKDEQLRNRILSVDYFGSLLGSLLFAVVILPSVGVFRAALVVASINALIATYLVFKYFLWSRISSALLIALCVLLSGSYYYSDWKEQFFLKRYYNFENFDGTFKQLLTEFDSSKDVERYYSKYQTIDFVELPKAELFDKIHNEYSTKLKRYPDSPRDYGLFLNNNPQVFSNVEEIYHEYFAHIGILRNRAVPKNVLVLGGGDGLLIRELLKYKDIESITLVDYDHKILELAKTHPVLSALNRHSLLDSRVETLVEDAFQFVRRTNSKYDAIFLDFPHPDDFNVSRVYSKEFYVFVRKIIAEGGFAAMHADGISHLAAMDDYRRQEVLPSNLWDEHYTTIKAAGFDNVIPYYSNLEVNNPYVFKVINQDNLLGLPEGVSFDARALAISRFVRMHILSVQMGFILMYDGPEEKSRDFKSPKLKLDVINQLRYQGAFRDILTDPEGIDEGKVNSIFKPRLVDDSPIYMPKMPFGVFD